MSSSNLPAPRPERRRKGPSHIKLECTAELMIDTETGRLVGIMLTTSNPAAVTGLERLLDGEYPGMKFGEAVQFRTLQFQDAGEGKKQVWLQREEPSRQALPAPQQTTVYVRQEKDFYMDR